ncbi:hypothetical protein HY382_00910 [Candidatus Curtissbacteria bacterium]|nr:hypothetical protein [Candidatus Curtissbacteria bacterium]
MNSGERRYYLREINHGRSISLLTTAGIMILAGISALTVSISESNRDNSRFEDQKIRITVDGTLSEEEKTELISQIPQQNDENQVLGIAGLFSVVAGVGFLGAAAVEASQKRK